MKKTTPQIHSICAALFLCSTGWAVNLNPQGHGQALIFPYYTVKNELNTVYSVVNTTAQAKAIKLRFLEGDAGMEGLEFNVYLGPHDVWNGALVPGISTTSGHEGEDTTLHLTSDESCAPFINKSGQEFLPFVIDQDAPNNDMERVTNGHMVVIEMGELTGESANHAMHVGGAPADCQALQEAWQIGGYWLVNPNTDLTDPTGGLVGHATLVNVHEGMAYSYAAVALDHFWQGPGDHGEPGGLIPSLYQAFPQSEVITNGQVLVSDWATGIEAVSATLSRSTVINQFSITDSELGRSEWVITFPTKNNHVNYTLPPIQPFISPWQGDGACEDFYMTYYDHNTIFTLPFNSNISPRPPEGLNPRFCYTTNVVQIIGDVADHNDNYSWILGADNLHTYLEDEAYEIDQGWAHIYLDSHVNNQMTPLSGYGFRGLPVVGFLLEQTTNASAQPGLVAQYGSLFKHSYEINPFASSQAGGQHE